MHIGKTLPGDGLRQSELTDFRLCAAFAITDEMFERLQDQLWIYLIERIPQKPQIVRVIIRWREAPPDYNTVDLLLEHLYRTMHGR